MSKNIFQRLLDVRKACDYLKKEKEGHQYSYVGSSDVLGALREAINEAGLILAPKVIDHAVSDRGKQMMTELVMEMEWVNTDNPEERFVCPWYGQGMDTGEKGVGKALTYAEKYYLLKFFNIPTDKDDPDAFQQKQQDRRPPTEEELEKKIANALARYDLCQTEAEIIKTTNSLRVQGPWRDEDKTALNAKVEARKKELKGRDAMKQMGDMPDGFGSVPGEGQVINPEPRTSKCIGGLHKEPVTSQTCFKCQFAAEGKCEGADFGGGEEK